MHFLKEKIQLDKQKGIVGAILAVLALGICCIWFEWYMGIVFAVLFLLAGFVRLDIRKTRWKYLWQLLWGVLVIWVTWHASMAMNNTLGEMSGGWDKRALNILCITIVCGVFFLLTANWRISLMLASFLLVFLCTANGLVYQFRGKELVPMDILSFRTAISVAGQYKPEIPASMVYGWLWWILVMLVQFSLPKLPKFPPIRTRLLVLLLDIGLITALWVFSADIPIKTWEKQGTWINGYYLNFFLGLQDAVVEKPENYDPLAVAASAQEYILVDDGEETQDLPNIIVIMDESFADFDIFGEAVRTNQPVTPFMDSLWENTIRGYALSSVYGANTANAEFEFLTGHSMAFLPKNSVPYQQYIRGKICTLPWQLNSRGYRSIATHPYYENGWSRNRLYPNFGFSESTFLESYESKTRIRDYVSDRGMFEFVLQKFAEKEPGEPLFLFGITMQNHGGYTYGGENYTQTIELEGYSREFPKAEQYLTLVHETDAAVEYLLTSLELYPEDTVVLFFGDHFPKVETEFYEELYGKSFDTLPEQILKYKIPFFIWANYDIPEETVECTSLNYLSGYLLKAAGISLPPYYRFLAEVEEQIPAMNALGYFSKSQNAFVPYSEAAGEEAEWLNQYSSVQYSNLFDSKHRNAVFFEQYIPPVIDYVERKQW